MATAADKSKINWVVACVSEFARSNSLPLKSAFQYLSEFGGISFLDEHYDAEHLLSFDDAVDDLAIICQTNGGMIQ